MTLSTPCSVSLVSPFPPPSQLASISSGHLLDTLSHMFSSSCQLDTLRYLTDYSGSPGNLSTPPTYYCHWNVHLPDFSVKQASAMHFIKQPVVILFSYKNVFLVPDWWKHYFLNLRCSPVATWQAWFDTNGQSILLDTTALPLFY